jgi:hypothetical protein
MNKPHWINDLIKCPSQCFCSFWVNNIIHYCIYLRWRWNDPWTCELVRLDDECDFSDDWKRLDVKDYSHDEYLSLQEEALEVVKSMFNNIKFDSETYIKD